MMDLEGPELHAAAALFTLAVHATCGANADIEGDTKPWGFPGTSVELDECLTEGMSPKPRSSVIQRLCQRFAESPGLLQFLDLTSPSGLLCRVYQSLSIADRSWVALMKLPELVLQQDAGQNNKPQGEAQQRLQQLQQRRALLELVGTYARFLDPEHG
eukprot:CAMPEP_0202913498 /NCGR_PEP_ID=MMETSP1392-20130828/60644_1 /ASSEMBLY_ACC=CAM_ASM_000868 /TAXON_ID=225041 /ORGANISM="Chlamydomonas chlamydogama, Strain SAG 11-48b" /LENGTH=157 /DNA_ID=CAMNT_0049604779 /DNA_START=36 /DNA_END=505 /DNA_ORIENTATION=+